MCVVVSLGCLTTILPAVNNMVRYTHTIYYRPLKTTIYNRQLATTHIVSELVLLSWCYWFETLNVSSWSSAIFRLNFQRNAKQMTECTCTCTCTCIFFMG